MDGHDERRFMERTTIVEFHHKVHPNHIVTTDRSRLDREAIFSFLTASYWAQGRSLETVIKTIENSLCFGSLIDGQQVGFARVVTDYTTVALLCDVFVIDAYRGQGIAKFLIECVLRHPDLQSVAWSLRTKDAHGLYEKFGFRRSPPTERAMHREPICPPLEG